MSIESQATFYLRNVCDYCSGVISDTNLNDNISDGFKEFSGLLRTIYGDWKSYEISTAERVKTKIGIMADDLENYHNLTYTLHCLYAIAEIGEMQFEGENKYLKVNKALFKSIYKRSATFPFAMLKKYGFFFRFLKGENVVNEYSRCDNINVYYENGVLLIESMKILTQRLSTHEKLKEMPRNIAFMLADYDFILAGNINTNPVQKGIINTLGSVNGLWIKLSDVLLDECGLIVDLSLNPYVFPNRTVTFRQNKKTICKFIVEVDRLRIRLPISYEAAKEIIIKRKSLPESINGNIDKFHCVNCGKCENSSNIEIFEGVSLCRLSYTNFITEDSRCIRITITSEEEVNTICDIIKQSLRKV